MFNNNPHYYPFSSKRRPVFAKKGMVATSQPLAAQAGLDMLKKGGNAIDAAIATAITLTVVEPTSNGIGGDAFAIVWYKGKLDGLNSSGTTPSSLTPEKLVARGYNEIPGDGVIPITVPGAPAAWKELSDKYGNLPFEDLFDPAISYAKEGFPVSPLCASNWISYVKRYSKLKPKELYKHWFDEFTINGRAPYAGELWTQENQAKTLQLIAKTKVEAFYKGELAKKIDEFIRDNDGYLTYEDLADYEPQWVKPISVNYRGYDIWEIPPNGQGLIALIALKMLEKYSFNCKESLDTIHKQIEALKIAFSDGLQYITDQKFMKISSEELLGNNNISIKGNYISDKAMDPGSINYPDGGTVYLATADQEGNMVSYIQSNYKGFGSGIVIPGTGIALQNRGKEFSLDPKDSNYLQPRKRTYHTIIPGFVTKEDKAIGPFGVMGGYMQPQGHLQVIMNSIDFKLNPQAAIDAPRWKWLNNKQVELEQSFPNHLAMGLSQLGHNIKINYDSSSFGRGQIIWKDESTGILVGGTESRTDGVIASW